jgi:hypothetical protein
MPQIAEIEGQKEEGGQQILPTAFAIHDDMSVTVRNRRAG